MSADAEISRMNVVIQTQFIYLLLAPVEHMPVYGRQLKYQDMSNITRALRSVLFAQATRSISLFGTSSFELLAGKPFRKHEVDVLKGKGLRILQKLDAQSFTHFNGDQIDDRTTRKKCTGGAIRRWERAVKESRIGQSSNGMKRR